MWIKFRNKQSNNNIDGGWSIGDKKEKEFREQEEEERKRRSL
jgi:hypothetical protein